MPSNNPYLENNLRPNLVQKPIPTDKILLQSGDPGFKTWMPFTRLQTAANFLVIFITVCNKITYEKDRIHFFQKIFLNK